nr:anti-repressor SinI family protein [Pullulanibacillus pueri]
MLDKDWVDLILLAKELDIPMDEIKTFLKLKQHNKSKSTLCSR